MTRFDKYLPSERLKPFIRYYVVSENESEQVYKILPSTSLVIGFQYKGRLTHFIDGVEAPLNRMGITGIQDRFTLFRNTSHVGTVLVYFSEIGAAAFLKVPVHELFDERVSLDTFIPPSVLERFEDKLAQASDDKQRIKAVETFLISQLNDSATDLLVLSAVRQIYQTKGLIRIKHLAERLNSSQSPLEKRFRKIVGASPKKFASIVRFQSVLTDYSPTLNLTETAYALGYYDQAHFIKDFRHFTGDTPEKFLLNR